MSKTRKVLLTVLALALLTGPAKLLLEAMLPDGAVDPVPGCIAGMTMSLLTLGLPAWLMRPWTSPRLMQQKSLLPGLMLAAATALLTRAAMSPVDAAWQSALGLTPDALPTPNSIPLGMLYLAALVIVPALAEEAFFRGALLTSLLDGSRRMTAALVTVMTFALLHGSLANLPSLLALSALLTLLMLHTGRLAVPMTAHLIYNLTALGWQSVPDWAGWMSLGAMAVLGGYLLSEQPKMAHPPMKKADGLLAAAAIATLILSYMI